MQKYKAVSLPETEGVIVNCHINQQTHELEK